ncbi:MAG: hypothetical protein KF723_01325 [Rhizobiaceae bacterium]|nr:hypothetical protein [Rhizobiaceae bacterium]
MAITTTYRLEDVRTEFRVNTVTAGDQNLSNVVGLKTGGYAVSYGSSSGGSDAVIVEVFDSATDTTPITVNLTADGKVGESTMALLSNGNIAVVWKEGPAGANSVVAAIVNPLTGAVVANDIVLAGHPDNTDPEIAALKDGGFALVTDVGTGINVFTVNNTGAVQSGVFLAGASDPAVAGLANGWFAVTYVLGGDVKARMFGANGVEVNGSGETWIADNDASAPQIAALNSLLASGFAVVFQDASFDDGSGQPGIGLRVLDLSSGTARVDNADALKVDLDPEIAVLANGFIVVTYTLEQSPTDTDVLTRIFDQSRNPISVNGGSNFVVDNLAANDEGQTSVAALLNGHFVTTWTDTAPGDANGTGISARIRELVRTQVGDGAGDSFTSDELRDEIYAGAGDDRVTVNIGGAVAGEVYNGGADSDTLVIFFDDKGTRVDLRFVMISEFERLDLVTIFDTFPASGARLTAQQVQQFSTIYFHAGFPTTQVADQTLEVFMGTSTSLSLSGVAIDSTNFTRSFIRIYGDGDAETVTGSSIADLIDTGAGNDTLNGWLGRDTLRGGLGNDTYVLGAEASGVDAVQDAGGVDTITSTITRSLAFFDFSEIEKLTLLGTTNVAGTGNRLANTITGNAGRNTLDGGVGNDTIVGGAGNDTIIGNLGRDTLTGGIGNDIFKFTNKAHSRGSTMDIITDFDDRGRGNDRIDVSALFGPKMKYIHDDAFTKAGQVRIKDIAGPDVIVEVNTGGSLAADFSIRLKGTALKEMSAGDFVL